MRFQDVEGEMDERGGVRRKEGRYRSLERNAAFLFVDSIGGFWDSNSR